MSPLDRYSRAPELVNNAFGRGCFAATSTIGRATIPADLAVDGILATMRNLAPPEPEQVIITPSLDALRAVVPFVEAEPTLRRSPTDFRTTDGIRVVVTEFAGRPQLYPAASLWMLGIGTPPMAAVFNDLAARQGQRYRAMKEAEAEAEADTPTVVEGPPDAAPTP